MTYDRHAVETWFVTSRMSPLTGQQLPSTHLIPNVLVRGQIARWRAKQEAARRRALAVAEAKAEAEAQAQAEATAAAAEAAAAVRRAQAEDTTPTQLRGGRGGRGGRVTAS